MHPGIRQHPAVASPILEGRQWNRAIKLAVETKYAKYGF
jgi:hypothetical protein